jgi:ATP-dependent DNA helicase RecG
VITSCGSPTRDEATRGGPRPGGIDAPISSLRGAGPVTAARLAARGIGTARDLLLRFPRGYDDLRRVTPLGALGAVADGTVVLVRGTVRRARRSPWGLLDVVLGDAEGGAGAEAAASVRARWFRTRAAMAKSFATGTEVALAGPLRTADDGTRELVHPRVVTAALAAGAGAGLGVRPRYAPIDGVPARTLERLYASALAGLDGTSPELIPPSTQARLGLAPLGVALRRLHAPEDAAGGDAEIDGARRRIALEALVVAQLAFLLRRAEIGPPAVRVLSSVADAAGARLEAAFGFSLTPSQRRSVDEIAVDLAGPRAMQRLLVGDVGSGKTAVAFAAAALVAAAGGVSLMMAPTESLAEQHARAFGPLAARLGFGHALLTGTTPAAARAAILSEVGAGRCGLVIGTQALLGMAGELPSLRQLGLVIVDEQHRFGVADRARLGRSGGATGGVATAPHLLAMSATPIPRSLALAVAGDLDASFLTERPPGRRPAASVLCAGASDRTAAYARLDEAVGEGRQAFVVCPVREEARRPGALTAVAHHARLRRQLAPARVGLVHGALPASEREAALRGFAAGEIDVLVATTVVELGIDVANATVMIVEEAERFGIAQLHQLRGRVGRGAVPGTCFLCPTPGALSAEAEARLALVAAVDDGFKLAEADLAQRGEGELFGTRQTGAPALGLDDLGVLAQLTRVARAEAEAILSGDPALARAEHRPLADAAQARARTLFAGEAG